MPVPVDLSRVTRDLPVNSGRSARPSSMHFAAAVTNNVMASSTIGCGAGSNFASTVLRRYPEKRAQDLSLKEISATAPLCSGGLQIVQR